MGIAIDSVHIPLDSPALQALVRADKRALRTIAEQPSLAVDYIASFLNRLTVMKRSGTMSVTSASTSPPTAKWTSTSPASDHAVAAELGVASVAADEIYLPAQ